MPFRRRAAGASLPRAVPVLLTALLLLGGAATARAQLVERVGSAEAPIYEDNLDAAKSRAVRGAQLSAIQHLLEELVAPEWVTLFGSELRKRVLYRPSRYISAYRVRRLEASADRTTYYAALAAQVNRALLVRDLRALSLPVKGDPVRALVIMYPAADPVFRQSALRERVVALLTQRLGLLNFAVQGAVPLSEAEAERLGNPFADAAGRGEWLSRRRVAAGLFLSYDPGSGEDGGESSAAHPELSAYLYQGGNGNTLGSFSVRSAQPLGATAATAPRFQEQVLARLVRPLAEQLQPGGIKPFGEVAGRSVPLRIRIMGVSTVEDEEGFAQAFFKRDSPFGDFVLERLDAESVTYRGTYTGDRKGLEVSLPGTDVDGYRINDVYWYNSVLELAVERTRKPHYTEMQPFSEELRPPQVAEAIDTYLREHPEYTLEQPAYAEKEDNGWMNRANTLPFNVTSYGFVDSRRDADFYVAEELKEGEVVYISWHRVGRTNLNPAVRIYDEQGQPVRFYFPKFWIRTKYEVPKGQHGFFVEVTDRFGAIHWDTGGYLSFNYLLRIEREGED